MRAAVVDQARARRTAAPAGERRCRDCGTRFVGEAWQRLCWSCWREQKDEQRSEDTYDQGFADGFATARRTAAAPSLDPDLLAHAIRLCHPDRHPAERAAEANAVTAQLLALRELAA
jgi:hypothetical protein